MKIQLEMQRITLIFITSPNCSDVPTITAIIIRAQKVDNIADKTSCHLEGAIKHTAIYTAIGIKLQQNEIQFEILKAATNAPTNIRNIVPGPEK